MKAALNLRVPQAIEFIIIIIIIITIIISRSVMLITLSRRATICQSVAEV